MINETGKGLSVLVLADVTDNWEAFCTWYSFFKNVPEARLAVAVKRTGDTPFVMFQWTKRLKLPTLHFCPFTSDGSRLLNWLHAVKIAKEKQYIGEHVLVAPTLTMALDSLGPKTLEELNKGTPFSNERCLFLRSDEAGSMIDRHCLEDSVLPNSMLFPEAKDSVELIELISFEKGCGRWINTAKGCPFSSAGGLVSTEMTVNEARIIELWKRMVPLYNTVV